MDCFATLRDDGLTLPRMFICPELREERHQQVHHPFDDGRQVELDQRRAAGRGVEVGEQRHVDLGIRLRSGRGRPAPRSKLDQFAGLIGGNTHHGTVQRAAAVQASEA